MRKKQVEQRFEMNRTTEVSIKSVEKAPDLYEVTTVVKHREFLAKPPQMNTHDAIKTHVREIDLDDDQVSLLGEQA